MSMFRFLWKKKPEKSSGDSFIGKSVSYGENFKLGHCTFIGVGDPNDGDIVIGSNVTIGSFCLIAYGSVIGDNVIIDDYCKVGSDVKIDSYTRILYGKHVYDEASIGKSCIIGGHVADRTIIEDNVTYMGEIAHSHRHPNEDWDLTVEPSPIIRKGSVVGVNALLIGGIVVGPCAYIAAGEIARVNVGEGMCMVKGDIKPLKSFRGVFQSRCNE